MALEYYCRHSISGCKYSRAYICIKVKAPCALPCKISADVMQYTPMPGFVTVVKDVIFSLKSTAFDAILNAVRCFRNVRHFRGHFMWRRQRRRQKKRRGKKSRTCLGGSSAESPETAMTFFSPSLRLPPALLPSQVPKSLDYWSKYRSSHTHILTQHDSNMWSGRNPYNGSAESHDAQGQLEDTKLKVWVLRKSRDDATSMLLRFFNRGTIVDIHRCLKINFEMKTCYYVFQDCQ